MKLLLEILVQDHSEVFVPEEYFHCSLVFDVQREQCEALA